MSDHSYQCEVGVFYRHANLDDPLAPGERRFSYAWQHLPSGKVGAASVVVLGNSEGFHKLLSHWNSFDLWKYYEV